MSDVVTATEKKCARAISNIFLFGLITFLSTIFKTDEVINRLDVVTNINYYGRLEATTNDPSERSECEV